MKIGNEIMTQLNDGLLDIADAQQFSGLSRSGLYQLMERGELSYTKIGKRRLIPKLALIKLASRGLVMAKAM